MVSQNLDNQFSITEKMIMDACDISKNLDASTEVPNIEGWPISKVSVLLVDSKKENCYLLFSSITQGVWSVIQKDVDVSKQSFQGTAEAKYADKKQRVIGKPLNVESKIDEVGFQQLAYLAVKEATGMVLFLCPYIFLHVDEHFSSVHGMELVEIVFSLFSILLPHYLPICYQLISILIVWKNSGLT